MLQRMLFPLLIALIALFYSPSAKATDEAWDSVTTCNGVRCTVIVNYYYKTPDGRFVLLGTYVYHYPDPALQKDPSVKEN